MTSRLNNNNPRRVVIMTLSQNNSDSNNKTTGQRIREFRHRRDITQQQLAKKLGVSSSTIHHWEHDRVRGGQPQSYKKGHGAIRSFKPSKARKKMMRMLDKDEDTKADINVNTALVYRLAHLEKEMKELTEKVSHLEREARSRGWREFPHSPFVHTPEGEQWNKHLFHRVELLEPSGS